MEGAKEEFLRLFRDDYGYPDALKNIDEMRSTEFKRLEGVTYLDHAGATLYSEAQLEAIFRDLSTNVYGNPHSQSDSSHATSNVLNEARRQVLAYFNASPMDYKCIFTSGATGALKLVGETFPWSGESCYMYTVENHNSVLGIREYALDLGATALAVDIEEVEYMRSSKPSIHILKHSTLRRNEASSPVEIQNGNAYNLFAFPSECNFSGKKFPLELVNIIKGCAGRRIGDSLQCRGSWLVLIDAAKGCATEPPDLARYPADFVACSFYKMFGFPTGLGALIVQNEAAGLLNKKYFSGGTVSASIADIDFVKRRESIEQFFEDGTVSFLDIAAIRHGFHIINRLTMPSISRHTASLATYTRNKLVELRHGNGLKLCLLYGKTVEKANPSCLGPTVTFNLKRSDGSWYGYREVEKLASLSSIQLRTGCFCNPGACAKFLGLSHLDLLSNLEDGHVCWDDADVLNGKPTGAVRISFGYMSTFEDAEKFVTFLKTSFVTKTSIWKVLYPFEAKANAHTDVRWSQLNDGVCLKSITVYPVKSCGGFSVSCWPLVNSGLKYDREWLLRGPNGEILTQKKVPQLCHVRTFVDLEQEILHLESQFCNESLQISLQMDVSASLLEEMNVYGQKYLVRSYGNEINKWFTQAISLRCTFIRCASSKHRSSVRQADNRLCRDVQSQLNFANEAQLLLISEGSVNDLNDRLRLNAKECVIENGGSLIVDAMRFRPNLVISGAEAYAEDNWGTIHVRKAKFSSLGGCNRCQMINIDQESGEIQKSKEPLATLASYRRVQGKILFGVLLRYENQMPEDAENGTEEEHWLEVGQKVHPSLVISSESLQM
ncbi:molybdenum cofactor sulfurase isoform X2 [Phalaenopsis equestris]|uniref:molybdenum cofactor sulfurase isoform X2 n=1 Tax=Phalaenopsis equestris TaxID=78828 RepID=UPI0009E4F31D|nr:molybdenum cofactor sulfurase isoform X2 [Phalaenopsis equestris]